MLGFSTLSSSPEDDDRPVHQLSYSRTSIYKNDDGSPTYVLNTTIYGANQRAVTKSFSNVVVPADSDLIVWVWSRGARGDQHRGTDIRVRVGNMNNGHDFSGPDQTDYIRINSNVAEAGWFKLRFYDADTFLTSGRVGVNLSGTSSYDYATIAYDSTKETGGGQYWYFSGGTLGSWSNLSGANTLFVRMEFVVPDPIGIGNDGHQIQFTSVIRVGSEYNSMPFCFQGSKEQLIDGETWANKQQSFGYWSGNNTVGNYINMTFHNRTVIATGDSLMCGYPHHNPHPNSNMHTDEYNRTPQYWLSVLLGQSIVDKSHPGRTTADMKERFESDVLANHPDYVIIEGGINDIRFLNSPAAAIEANLTVLMTKSLENNSKVILCTIPPDSTLTVQERQNWNLTNAWIRLQSSDDIKIVDLAAHLAGSQPWMMNPTFSDADGFHLNQRANSLFANLTFEIGFRNVYSSSQNCTVNEITFHTHNDGTNYIGKPGTINMSYRGGYEIITLTNTENFTYRMANITTDFLNFTMISYNRLGTTYAPNFMMIGEIQIFGSVPHASQTKSQSVTITYPTRIPTYSTSWHMTYLKGVATDDIKVTSITWVNSKGGSGIAYMTPQYGAACVNWQTRGNIYLQPGLNVIFVIARDGAGNSVTETLTIAYQPPDAIPPSVSITAPTSLESFSTGWHMTYIMGTATDDTKVASVTWTNSLGGSGTAYMNPQYGGSSVSWQGRGNILLYHGQNVITVTATDSNGNTAKDVLTVTYTGY